MKKRGRRFHKWIDDTGRLIRSMAPGQLVTTGSEGQTGSATYAAWTRWRTTRARSSTSSRFHLWGRELELAVRTNIEGQLPQALDKAKAYINDHAARAAKLDKPLLLEEFGFPRDQHSFAADSPVTIRDKYFDEILRAGELAQGHVAHGRHHALGVRGDARPPRPEDFWKPGDPFIGDPPHEKQGVVQRLRQGQHGELDQGVVREAGGVTGLTSPPGSSSSRPSGDFRPIRESTRRSR